MKTPRALTNPIIILIILFFLTLKISAQDAVPTTRYFHYASATGTGDGKKVLYVSKTEPIDFVNDYTPLTDTGLKENLEGQYLYFLKNKQGEDKAFTFSNYAMLESKEQVAKKRAEEISTFKKQGFKIISVKGFKYD